MDQKIDALIVEPGKEPRLSSVSDNLDALEQIVGGPIDVGCYLPQRVMLICNSEGKNKGLLPNRPNPMNGEDFIYGTFLLFSFEGDHFASLTPDQQTRFQEHFALAMNGQDRGAHG